MHESKFPFVSRIEFIRSKLSNFSAHVYGGDFTDRTARLRRGFNDDVAVVVGCLFVLFESQTGGWSGVVVDD